VAACEAQASIRKTLIGIALIWIAAQVLAVVAHDLEIRTSIRRNISGEWDCGKLKRGVSGFIAMTGKGRFLLQPHFLSCLPEH
jgi:hypothetical protein